MGGRPNRNQVVPYVIIYVDIRNMSNTYNSRTFIIDELEKKNVQKYASEIQLHLTGSMRLSFGEPFKKGVSNQQWSKRLVACWVMVSSK